MFEVAGSGEPVKTGPSDSERIGVLEAEIAELKRSVETLTEKLAEYETKRSAKKK